nr:hypothetical protein CFP56_48441 [Quercus suber]
MPSMIERQAIAAGEEAFVYLLLMDRCIHGCHQEYGLLKDTRKKSVNLLQDFIYLTKIERINKEYASLGR